MAQDQPVGSSVPTTKPSNNGNADIIPVQRPAVPGRRWPTLLKFLSSIMGSKDPLAHAADPSKNTIWLLDNTAYQPVSETSDDGKVEQWQAEFIACIFEKGSRKDVGKLVAAIADHIGIDGEYGRNDQETRKRIEKRVQPFLDQVSPARKVKLEVTVHGHKQTHPLGGSDRNGIISQIVELGVSGVPDGTVAHPHTKRFKGPLARMATRFAAPGGWMVISDIDDTIKRTMTREPTGILRTTFAEEPVPIAGMPEFYRYVHGKLNPTWFYLSASPYNLYPFLHQFLHENYCPGTVILRDYSWMDISGLIKSFTEKTQEYKVDRMEKVRGWLPRRQVLCIGDSTQKDPEAYAEMYSRYPDWIHAIIIRKVTDVEHMEDKNKPERFEKAFKNVPSSVWTVFEDTQELYAFVDGLRMKEQDL